jgi:hypothetical protein
MSNGSSSRVIKLYPRENPLTIFCRDNNVPAVSCRRLRAVADDLAHFEKNKTTLVRTTRKRFVALKRLLELATEMQSIIGAMPEINERTHLEVALRKVGAPAIEFEDALGFTETSRVEHIKRTIALLARACQAGGRGFGTDGKGGGRRVVQVHYATFIYRIAMVCRQLEIKPGRGGKFQALCEAVFKSADVHSSVEGPVRFFMTHYDEDANGDGLVL